MPQSADDRAANPDRDFVTIVTGLPRSGTSMMMQMLIAGGLPALTDQQRQPDEDNPRGYFELDDAKRLGQGHVAWLPSAAGRCVKIVVPLIAHVPQGNYRVIVMERDLDEILQSQHAMLARSGKRGARLPPEQLKAILAKHLREADALLTQWGCPTVRVAYRA
ncbi:MAG TPA: hypothetical protein PKC18_19950, partial [Lacipirellulaceae bacterium]|nr:hypothetical protein [Lacipirellulaceae bacterium]